MTRSIDAYVDEVVAALPHGEIGIEGEDAPDLWLRVAKNLRGVINGRFGDVVELVLDIQQCHEQRAFVADVA